MPVTTTNFGRLLDPGIREIFFDRLRSYKPVYTDLFNVLRSTRASEQDLTMIGLEDWRVTQESKASQFTSPLQGFVKNYVHDEWTSGIKITRKMLDDDQYNIINRFPAKLAETALRTIDKKAALLFNNAFNTTYFTGADGVGLVSASHTREDGGTNISNTATGVLNENNLETGMVAMMETLDGRGELVDTMPDTLLVPPALEKEARILVDSPGRTGTASNELNPYKGALNVKVWKRLGAAAGGSDSAWFLLDSGLTRDGGGLNVFMRVNPEISMENELETHVSKWVGYMRFSVGFTGWRGLYASTGTTS